MLVSELTPKVEGKVLFDLSHLEKCPDESGCYVITASDDTILYIGQAVNICRRMESHRNDDKKRENTPYGKAFWFYYKLCPKIELDDLERGWLNDYLSNKGNLPFFNKQRGNI